MVFYETMADIEVISITIMNNFYMSQCIGKSATCIGKNKDADQLCSNCTADQHLYFHNTDVTNPLLPKSEISHFLPSSVTVQASLCQLCKKNSRLIFSHQGRKTITYRLVPVIPRRREERRFFQLVRGEHLNFLADLITEMTHKISVVLCFCFVVYYFSQQFFSRVWMEPQGYKPVL